MSTSTNPYLKVPLSGVQVIEASAGTGKTFTLATLVLRLLIENNWRIGEILAVTFTEAATQELRSRIRARLLLALDVLDGRSDDASPEAAVTREVLERHLRDGDESRQALQRRIREAVDGIDLASIFTIHGFCARVLREHALESGQGFDAPELLANDAALRDEVAADLWRVHAAGANAADLLGLWPRGPEALAADVSLLVREPRLVPAPAPLPDDPTPLLRKAAAGLMSAALAHGDTFRAELLAAIDNDILNRNSYKHDWINPLFDALALWCQVGNDELPFDDERFGRLTGTELTAKTKKAAQGRTPDSPLCKAISIYLDARDAVAAYREQRQVHLLHDIAAQAKTRLAQRKRQLRVQTYDDLIDRVAEALDGADADALAAALRAQYRIALVDEFQDTDSRQWRIFDRVFGKASGDPSLFLIGDPKQAIYGFRGGDVDTYLAAAATAAKAPRLDQNFRSRPSVLTAVEVLYDAAGPAAFKIEDIRFLPVQPGGVRADDDLRVDGTTAPALTVWVAPPSGEVNAKGVPKPHQAEASRALATEACVAEIHRLLSAAAKGAATVDGRALQPGDIAVLVRTHHEATRIRQALAEVGIPAVAAGRQSLFATDEARELHAILLALLHTADDGRLRMALATVLLGVDAAGIDALDADADALHAARLRALAWRERLHAGGVLALINDLCAEHAQRLLGLLDGERRLTNYLQLGEHLQAAQAGALGLAGLVDWLARAIAGADEKDEAQLLRLESDARRVQIVTLHKSKGLEYPLVFLPFVGIGGRSPSPGNRLVVNTEDGRVLHWKLRTDRSGWEPALTRWKQMQIAEDARLLYVGLTRASHSLWLAAGPLCNHGSSALAPMFGDPEALVSKGGNAIVIREGRPAGPLPRLQDQDVLPLSTPRPVRRALNADWWVYSFTQLAHADGGQDTEAAAIEGSGAAADESDAESVIVAVMDDSQTPADLRFSGSRFGNVLHAALERVDFAAWAGWRDDQPLPDDQYAVLTAVLAEAGYAQSDLDDGCALLASLVGRTLNAVLPEGGALHSLPASQRRAEIEFHFAMQPTRVTDLLALLQRYGIARTRSGFGLRRRLEGLMTGKIDLTYVRDGRWYVLDYKSNRLPAYDPATLAQAMVDSEYDLQALIYTLALHRWLRLRLPDYDYARDMGGIRYLFCRGLPEPHNAAHGSGIHAQCFEPALVDALDALFGGDGASP